MKASVSKRLGEANLLGEFLAGQRETLKLERAGNEVVLEGFWEWVAEGMGVEASGGSRADRKGDD